MQPSDIQVLNDFLTLDPEAVSPFLSEFKAYVDATRPVGILPHANGEYPICKAADFYAIPADKLQECLDDFAPTLVQLAATRKMATSLGVPDAAMLIEFNEAVWRDDNVRTATIIAAVSIPGEPIFEVQTTTNTGPT